jgi:hypothetical protein
LSVQSQDGLFQIWSFHPDFPLPNTVKKWRALCLKTGMTKLAFIADERSGSVHATLVPANRHQETHVRLLGLTFVALLLLAVAELVYLLAR